MPNSRMMPRNGASDDSDSTDHSFKPSRRTYLKAAGAAAVSVPLLAGEGAAATERHGISFDNVVDMVDDAGCDPSGNEPCDSKLQSAAGSNTLLKFPSGTFKFTGKNSLNGYSNFGILGEGDTTFTVPDDFNDKLLTINYGTGVLVENITVDQENATPTVQVAPDDGLEVHNLEIVGQSIVSGGSGAGNAFEPMVRSSGGEGMVENLVAHNAGKMGAYARVGVWIGDGNKGTITLRNCNVEGFSNNGVYASRTPGVVKVEGGTYKNNDLSQIRVGSAGSYIDGATAETDLSESNSPNPDDMLNGSGIRIEGENGSGAEVRNCDIRVGPEVNANGGIQVFSNYNDFSIENTRVEFNPDGGYSIRALSPGGSGDVSGTFSNVSVTGDASGLVGVLIEDRPDTTVENCCIQQTGSGRVGLALDNCDGSEVTDCTINAGAQALRVRNSSVSTSGIDESGTCPAPNLGSSSYDGSSSSSSESSSDDSSSDSSSDDESSSSSDSSSDDSSDSSGSSSDDSSSSSSESSSGDSSSDSSSDESSDSSESTSDDSSSGNPDGAGSDDSMSGNIDESEVPEPSGNANFIVTDTSSEGDRIPYEITATDDIEKADTGGATQDSNDDISGNTADGGVNQWRDAYEYEGEIASLEVDDRATIKLDKDNKSIAMIGQDDGYVDYSLEVTGDLTPEQSITGEDSISGGYAEGSVDAFRDVYTYTGHLIQASIEDSVSITTDPDTLD